MDIQNPPKVAKQSGIYRCTGLGQTVFLETGQSFPNHECKKGVPCNWEFNKEDNMDSKNAITILIGQEIIHAISTDELPEIGHHYNIREANGCGLVAGKHKVISIEEDFQWDGKSFIRIMVEQIGDLSDEIPIHQAHQITI